jgi:hypothetical protein
VEFAASGVERALLLFRVVVDQRATVLVDHVAEKSLSSLFTYFLEKGRSSGRGWERLDEARCSMKGPRQATSSPPAARLCPAHPRLLLQLENPLRTVKSQGCGKAAWAGMAWMGKVPNQLAKLGRICQVIPPAMETSGAARSHPSIVDAIIKSMALTPPSRSQEAEEKASQPVRKFVGPPASEEYDGLRG